MFNGIYGVQAQFQPTLPLRGATSYVTNLLPFSLVSTHAPLAGSDRWQVRAIERDTGFQPTLPLRGATPIRSFYLRKG